MYTAQRRNQAWRVSSFYVLSRVLCVALLFDLFNDDNELVIFFLIIKNMALPTP